MNATQKGEVNEQHQNVTKPVIQKDLATFSTTHQKTPQTTTQPRVMNFYNGDNHKLV